VGIDGVMGDASGESRSSAVTAGSLEALVDRIWQLSATQSRQPTAREAAQVYTQPGSVAEWLACWTRAQKGPGSNRSRDAVG